MNGKQKVIRWLKYHGGSTMILAVYLIVALLGGMDLSPRMIVVTFLASAVFVIALETLIWGIIAWIMGWRFIGYILHDPWAIKKAGKQTAAYQTRKGDRYGR